DGVYDGFEEFVKKYLMYAKTYCPTISEGANTMLTEYWIKMAKVGIRGLPRKLEALKRMAIARAKLKLKNVADVEEAEEIMKFYNVLLQHYNQTIPITKNPRNIAYGECIDIIENSGFAISFEDVIRSACQRNEQVRNYIGSKFKLENNKKLRPLLDMLLNHDSVKAVQQKPWVLQWIKDDNSNNSRSGYGNIRRSSDGNDNLYDLSDSSDFHRYSPKNNIQPIIGTEEENSLTGQVNIEPDRSDRSDSIHVPTSDSPKGAGICQQQIESFFHDPDTPWQRSPEHDLEQSPCYYIIEKDKFKISGQTYYYCKIHPDVWNIDLVGVEHHCKYKDPDLHKSESLRLALKMRTVIFSREKCIK
ncbi:MAG TPA: hypothetical protein VFS97_08820, partial [Nitrososphaeraceae archaeon]|nr:hypothetical protein [Nitrososphaeraceae archaeon]